ncbi:MAG: molybdopterin synthase catalytic subunit MoaE [Alphaproteobacteria bacterium]|jgi:molybdopterin synthase catalytic subunit|nr:molybdopterin synthase catalytic subunit MoaE [Alphaproteobacteria bacterium]
MIRVQAEDFDVGAELAALSEGRHEVGAVASFVGLVRDLSEGDSVQAMELQHYPGMTERQLARIEDEARRRWPLDEVLIIHRYGRMAPGERIVLCAASSAHRQAALEACAFLIDWLKTKAPFWKLEDTGAGDRWVESRESDDTAAARWQRG